MTPYEAYLRSPHWLYIREAKLGYSQYTCADCGYRRFPYKWGMSKRLEVHHLTYERLGREKLADLVVLCEDCHAARHNLPPRPRPIARSWWPIATVLPFALANIENAVAAAEARRKRRYATNPHAEAGILDRREDGPHGAARPPGLSGADLYG